MNEKVELLAGDNDINLYAALRVVERVGGSVMVDEVRHIKSILRRAIVAEETRDRFASAADGLEKRLRAALEDNRNLAEKFAHVEAKYLDLQDELEEFYAADTVPVSDFDVILAELKDLHDKKAEDYGADGDPLANIRQGEKYGIPSWLGAIIRVGDKIARIQAFAKKGRLTDESVEDSLRDLAVYAVIALQLYREQENLDSLKAEEALASEGDAPDEGEGQGAACGPRHDK